MPGANATTTMAIDNEERRRLLRSIRNTPLPSADPAYPHAVNIPVATYAPWAADPMFLAAYAKAQANTLVDLYRCHELWSLARRQRELPGDAIEVGTWRGGSGALLAKAFGGRADDPTVFLCDTFAGVVKAGARDTAYKGGEHADASRASVEALMAALSIDNVTILEGIFPDQTGHQVADRRFSLCHIDVDVYDSARDVFEWVVPRLVRHGAVVFDDYGFLGCEGVTRIVNELSEDRRFFTFCNLNGHAVLLKLDD